MVVYRRATPEDTRHAAFRGLVLRGLHRNAHNIEVDTDKLWAFCEHLAVEHLVLVAEADAGIIAYLGGQILEHPWLPRSQLNVVGWYSEWPWAGMRLLNQCLSWVRERPFIISVHLCVDADCAERVERVLKARNLNPLSVHGFFISVR